ncbi:MAG: hypothetical protein JWP39_472 [Jatrophihabitans sp.]|nr:hypothetical protein [Jatrophihabitans sp.]
MISYAQNAEDVVLARAFTGRTDGFFVDVGANEPTHDSVTRHFADRGWTGINIEPQVTCFQALERERPKDINLNVGVSSEPGRLTFYYVPDAQAMSTFSAEHATLVRSLGYHTQEREIDVRTLDDVFEHEVGGRTVDFLKVDVEGLEDAVLGQFDWTRFRPRVVLVESSTDVDAWERRMLAAGYRRTLWDGINLFFVRSEDDDELGPALTSPATIVLDRFDPWYYVEQLELARTQVQTVFAAHFLDVFARRGVRGPAAEAAAGALAKVLSWRPDVGDTFGVPPHCDADGLLRWACTIQIGDDEPYSEPLSGHLATYESAAAHASAGARARTLLARLGRKAEALRALRRR